MENREEFFTCGDCRCHELYVVYCYTQRWLCTATVPCDCGEAANGIAAERMYWASREVREAGPLGEDHRWRYDPELEESDEGDDEEEGYEIWCPECFQIGEPSNWEISADDPEVDEDSEEFYVCCAGCDREIEFGWSHPKRGGRIWPAECADFNPWKSWPEPRYRAHWLEKGWIRPDFRERSD